MDEEGTGKLSGIWQIIRLKEILHKWHNTTLNSRQPNQNGHPHPGGIAPEVSKRLRNSTVRCDSDDEGCHSPEPPLDVPKGNLAIYVGLELRRFIIPTAYLSHHLFKVLLKKAEEEFGFDHDGGLTIPCNIETFKYLLKCIETENMNEGEHLADAVGESA